MYTYTTILLLMTINIHVAAKNDLCYNDATTVRYCDNFRHCCQWNTRCCSSGYPADVITPVKYGEVCGVTRHDVSYCESGYHCCGFHECCPNGDSSDMDSSDMDIRDNGLSAGAIAGLVICSLVGLISLIVVCCVLSSKCLGSSTKVNPIHIQQYSGRDVVVRY